MFFDSHAHYDDKKFDRDRHGLIDEINKTGVSNIINVGADISSSKESVKLANRYDFIYASVGVHPHDVSKMSEGDISILTDLASDPKVVAIGEIGLDYHYDFSPRDVQKLWFRRQLQLAKELKLPVIIHNREAHADSMEIVQSEGISRIGGVFHCFSGSYEMAEKLLQMGLYLSVAGPVTFSNAKKLVEVVKRIPMDRMLIETDAPYLAPEPFRGKRNDSGYIKFTAEKIAEIKDMTLEEVAKQTSDNAKRLFGI